MVSLIALSCGSPVTVCGRLLAWHPVNARHVQHHMLAVYVLRVQASTLHARSMQP